MNRLYQAADNAPPFQHGEVKSEGVKALQQALIAFYDGDISIPAGPTGNYLEETVGAVRGFQKSFHLTVDGVAGKQTITTLDGELYSRSRRVLERLDRSVSGSQRSWTNDADRLQNIRMIGVEMQGLKITNVMGFAIAAAPIALLVLLFFLIMTVLILSTPAGQKALRILLSETIEAVRGRGEVASEKIQELKIKIDELINEAREIETDCRQEKLISDPTLFSGCLQKFDAARKAAFGRLITNASHVMTPHVMTWIIAALATAGVILRPFDWPEAIWALAGAALLVVFGLLSPGDALTGVGKGTDVYLFLTGMMLLSEIARQAGLFDWLAAVATKQAKGSASRLFLLVYGVGTLVTIFLSNDAAAVVLTPAVAAAVKAAKVEQPLPFLLICAFIANAASFVLPISNPANLVIYGSHMPALLQWLPRYALPSLLSIAATFVVLRWTQRDALKQEIETDVSVSNLSGGGKMAALGLAATAGVLLTASFVDIQLGLPTAIAGAVTAIVVLIREKKAPWSTLKDISWGVLPLVAGLFVLVEALDKSGLIRAISSFLQQEAQRSVTFTTWGAGTLIAFACNLMNNLPAGLIAGNAIQTAHVPEQVTSAVLIGVDLGPNLSVTGSLATILWLTALRREGQNVSAWTFLKLGFLVMPPALLLAIAATFLFR